MVFPFFGISEAVQKQRIDAWTWVAQNFQLWYQNDVITGTLGGFPIAVHVETRQMSSGMQKHTIFRVQLAPTLPGGLSLQPEIALSGLAAVLGITDFRLGIEDLDPRLLVGGHDPEAVRAWARRPAVLGGLRLLVQLQGGGFRVKDQELVFDYISVMANAAQMDTLMRQLVWIASCFA